MKHGPVPSQVLDLITDMPLPAEESFWNMHISPPSNWEVSLQSEAGSDSLSEAEEEKIDQIWKEFGPHSPFSLVDLMHAKLPEWQAVQEGRIELPYRDILLSEMTESAADQIESELASVTADHQILCAR